MGLLQKANRAYTYQVSILIPMYNEESSILFVLNKVKTSLKALHFEIIVVDDGSQDRSGEKVKQFIQMYPDTPVQYHYQKNQGKGGAIRTAIQNSQGEILVVQDADMEYEPSEIAELIEPFHEGAQVVYGSRNLNLEDRKHSTLLFYWGGLLVTFVTNLLYGSKLTDEATGYKLFHARLFEEFDFKQNDFAWEPEITAKILKKKIEIVEKPISYTPRSKAEGKKISWKDGLKALWILLLERFKP
jgi:dolichol-phosphate mannosyltransferase